MRPSGARRARAAHVVLAALLAAPLPGITSSPAAASPGVHKAPSCNLQEADVHRHDEWLSCFQVDAELSEAPAVGETARLSYTVTSDLDADSARIDVELPDNFRFVDAPDESIVLNDERDGEDVTVARSELSVSPGTTRSFDAVVEATAPGSGQIRVNVLTREGPGTSAAQDDLFLTVGRTD